MGCGSPPKTTSSDEINNSKIPKLNYLPVNSRGSIIRAIFNYTKTHYENNIISFEKFPELKGNFEFGQVPMLEHQGLEMVQTNAIILCLARQHKLMGNGFEDDYNITSLLYTIDEMFGKVFGAIVAFTEEQKAAIPENRKKWEEECVPFYLPKLEEKFNSNNGKYTVGNSFTVADIAVSVWFSQIFGNEDRKAAWMPMMEQYAPNLCKHVMKIRENELCDYFKKDFIITFV